MREALADDLLPGERGPLHTALARALEADPGLSVSPSGVTAELAFHWFAAHNLPAAFSASAQAGAEAMRLAAFAEANAHYERAIELWDGVPEDVRAAGPSLVDLIRSAAEAAHLAGEDDRAAALARRALTLVDADADPMTAALVGERLGRYLWISGNSLEGLESCRAAVALLPHDGRPGGPCARPRARRGTCSCCWAAGSRPSRSASRRSPSRAPPAPAARRAASSPPCAPPRASPGRSTRGSSTARRRCASPRSAATPRRWRGPTSTSARPSTGPGASPTPRSSPATARWWRSSRASARSAPCWPATQAVRLLRLGRWDDADLAVARALDAAVGGVHAAAALAGRGLLDVLRGRFDDVADTVEEARRAQENALGSMWTGPVTIVAAELALWRGDPLAARDEVAAMLDGRRSGGRRPLLPDPGLRGRRAGRRGPGRRRARDRRRGGRARRLRARRRVRGARAPRRPPGRLPGRPLPARVDAQRWGWPRPSGRGPAAAAGPRRGATWARTGTRSACPTPRPMHVGAWRRRMLAEGGARADAQSALAAAHAVAVRLRARPLAAELEALARGRGCRWRRLPSPSSPTATAPRSAWDSRRASWRSCASWPRARPIARSARRSTSARRPSACTSRGSWPSSTRAAASRRRAWPCASASWTEEAEAVPEG